MAKLFEPLRIRDVEFRNRIVVSPMCEYSSEDGFANDWHLVHLGTRAVGGAGLVFTEATAVSAEGRISPYDLGIWKDEHIPFLKRIVTFLHGQGAVAGIQLAHAGRKASVDTPWKGNRFLSLEEGGWQNVAPSAVSFKSENPPPHELTKDEIRKVAADFRQAAIRAVACGFKVVEIHAAHGYLLNEFLSPASNFRNDEYGGSFEKRLRLLLEVIEEIKSVWPQGNPIFLRISASEWSDIGWTIDDSVKLANVVKVKGIDLVDCSSGGNVYHAKVVTGALYQVRFSEKVKNESGILTGAVGLITTPKECEEILQSGRADMIFLARQLLRDPYFPLHAAKELNVDLKWPVQYERAKT